MRAQKKIYTPTDHTFAVCAYKESPYIEECILSLNNQTIKSNIIITTSTPCKQTEQIAEKFQIPLYVNKAKPGIGSDWNFAYDSTQTPLVTIAHQDDIYEPDYTSQMLEYINHAKDPIIYFCGYGEIRNHQKIYSNSLLNIKKIMLNPLKKDKNWGKKRVRRRILSFGNAICCPSVTYVKNKIIDSPFDTSLKCNLDWDQWERLSKKDGAFVYNPLPLMCHRVHSGSETSALIIDNTRTKEDKELFSRFWGKKIASIIEKMYSHSQKSNKIDC